MVTYRWMKWKGETGLYHGASNTNACISILQSQTLTGRELSANKCLNQKKKIYKTGTIGIWIGRAIDRSATWYCNRNASRRQRNHPSYLGRLDSTRRLPSKCSCADQKMGPRSQKHTAFSAPCRASSWLGVSSGCKYISARIQERRAYQCGHGTYWLSPRLPKIVGKGMGNYLEFPIQRTRKRVVFFFGPERSRRSGKPERVIFMMDGKDSTIFCGLISHVGCKDQGLDRSPPSQ